MLRIRRFEERCVELYSAAEIRGFMHLCIGEEAVAVGVLAALDPEDAVVSTYREHGHALARGACRWRRCSPRCSAGRPAAAAAAAARCTCSTPRRRFYGGNAIVAGGHPAGGRAGTGRPTAGPPRVTACLFGDGAAAEGEFHESLNLAALWRLPVLFCCENNQYAMGTALARSHAQTDLALRAASYGMRSLGRGRHGRRRGARGGPARRRHRPRRRRSLLPGAAHLPVPRALDVRRGPLPRQGRDRAVARARPGRSCSRRAARRGRPRRRRGRTALEAEVAAEIDRAVAAAEAGPLGAGRGPAPAFVCCAPAASSGGQHRPRAGRASGARDAGGDDLPGPRRPSARPAGLREPAADERVFLMGEDVGRYGGCFGVSQGLLEEFGPERIRDTPLSESAFVGAGIGAAWAACARSSRS